MKYICTLSFLFITIFHGWPKGLEANYSLDGNHNDHSGNGRHLTNYGTSFTADRNGVPNNSALLADSVYLDSKTSFDYEQRTISVWFARSASANSHHVILNQDSQSLSYGSFTLAIQSSGNLVANAGGDPGHVLHQKPNPWQWYHVVMVRDVSSTSYYMDGVLISSGSPSGAGSTNQPNTEMLIGVTRTASSRFFNGAIDDILIYSDALTHMQIDSIHTVQLRKRPTLTAQIYPNPAEDYVNIQIEASIRSDYEVNIAGIGGKTLAREFFRYGMEKLKVETNHLPKGVYVIVISGILDHKRFTSLLTIR